MQTFQMLLNTNTMKLIKSDCVYYLCMNALMLNPVHVVLSSIQYQIHAY